MLRELSESMSFTYFSKPESSYRILMTKEWPQGEMDWSPEGPTPEQWARKIASELGDEEYLARHVTGARPAHDLERQVERLWIENLSERMGLDLDPIGEGFDDEYRAWAQRHNQAVIPDVTLTDEPFE